MSKQQHSASLQIVEDNGDLIQISQNSFQLEQSQPTNFFQPQKFDDTFELSLDENSLSFHIEELKLQSTCDKPLKVAHVNSQIKVQKLVQAVIQNEERKPLPVAQEQRKRKRKEIFEKYKQKTTQNILASPELQPTSNDIMNTFDEIFRIKSPQKTQKKQFPSPSFSRNMQLPSNVQATRFKRKQSIFEIAPATSFQQFPANISSPNKNYAEPPLVGKTQSKTSLKQFQIPSNFSQLQTIDPESNLVISCTNSFIMQNQDNKISMIYAQEGDISRDSWDLEIFLKSQIFRDEILQNTIMKSDTSYKNIQITTVNPSMMIFEQSIEASQNNNIQNRFGIQREKPEANSTIKQKNQVLERNLSETNLNVFETIQLQPAPIISQRVSSYEQNRIPGYLRQIRKRNTTYPNFHLKLKSKSFYQEQNGAFKELLGQFKKGLSFLSFMNEVANERHCVLISLQKVLLNSLTVQTFLTCGWQRVHSLKQASQLQPYQNFMKRKYEYQKVKGALSNYLYIVQYYQNLTLNLQEQRAQQKYLEIRAKFWQIQKNVKMIGEDIYLLTQEEIFPKHYYEFLNVLKGIMPRLSTQNQLLEYCRKLLAKYYMLAQQSDLLCLSEIGKTLRSKLQKMIHKTFIV